MNSPIRPPRTVALTWQRYLPLNLANVQAYAPDKAGVYKIAVNLLNGDRQVVYAGQAANLGARLRAHLSEWESNRELRSLVRQYQCSFALAFLLLQDDRSAAERALYLNFRPYCNGQVPSGPAYFVTPLTSA